MAEDRPVAAGARGAWSPADGQVDVPPPTGGHVTTPVTSLPAPLIEPRRGYRFAPENLLLPDLVREALAPGARSDRSADPPCPSRAAQAGLRVLDLGAGCGVLGLLAAAAAGPGCRVELVERDGELGWCAAANAVALNRAWSEPRARLVRADVQTLSTTPADLIVANPPFYAASEGRQSRNPSAAGATHALHGDVRSFVACAGRHLAPGGALLLLYPADRLAIALEALRDEALHPRRVVLVHARHTGQAYRVWVHASAERGGCSVTSLSAVTER